MHPLVFLIDIYFCRSDQALTGSWTLCCFCFPAAGTAVWIISIAFFGQREAHMPQPMHFDWSTVCTDFTWPEIALTGQTFSQMSIPAHFAGAMKAFGRTGM